MSLTDKLYDRFHLNPGSGQYGALWLTVELRHRNGHDDDPASAASVLSICGVEGPKSNGDCRGGCGQTRDALDRLTTFAPGWSAELAKQTREAWDRWHLNDMRAGCAHQRAAGWKTCQGHYPPLSDRVRFIDETDGSGLVHLKRTRVTLTNCAGVEETRVMEDYIGSEFYHGDIRCSLDCLSKPCPTCGYKYGSRWLFEPLPEAVLAFILALPRPANLSGFPANWQR